MNEGWATFWHYTLLNHLYDEGLVTDRFMLEFLQSHTNVVAQPPITALITTALTPMPGVQYVLRHSPYLRTANRGG